MLIQRQFRIAYSAILASIVAALALVALMHLRLQRMDDLRSWSNDVMRAVFDCNFLGSETILQENARSQEQFAIVSIELGRLLNSPPQSPGMEPMIAALRAHKKRMDSLVAEFASRPEDDPAAARERFELQTMLVSQWMLQTRQLLGAAGELRNHAVNQSHRLRGASLLANLLAVSLVAAICGVIFWRLNKTLVTPLRALSVAARRIGEGDLDYRAPVQSQSELGLLAENFNTMAAQLRARQAELDEKIRDLETFSYSMAHDLKAPLRGVAGYAGFLHSEYRDQLDDEARDCLDRMRLGCARMSSLIDDLLQFGQLTHKPIEIKPVAIESVVGQLLVEMEPEIRARNGEVIYQGGAIRVRGNSVVLKQALRNLISNGIKFVPQGVTPRIAITADQQNGTTTLKVTDNGIGIPAEHQKKIFGLFQRLHTQKEYPGTGVGLAIVQKSAERMQGQAGVHSTPGQGSSFWLRLPSAE